MTEPWLAASEPVPGARGAAQRRTGPATRETVKRDMIALFKRVDGALNELGQLKDGIRAWPSGTSS